MGAGDPPSSHRATAALQPGQAPSSSYSHLHLRLIQTSQFNFLERVLDRGRRPESPKENRPSVPRIEPVTALL